MLVLRVPAFRPLEFMLLFFCGRHVSPRSTQLRQLRAQVPGVIRELLDVADGLKLRLPGGWSLVQMGPRESQALLHLRRYLRRCRRQRPLIYRLPRLIINPARRRQYARAQSPAPPDNSSCSISFAPYILCLRDDE